MLKNEGTKPLVRVKERKVQGEICKGEKKEAALY